MSPGLRPYPAYKDPGAAWLGEVPEHWEVRRLRNVADMRVSNVDKLTSEHEASVRLCNYVDVYKNERITDRIEFMRVTATAEETERFRLNSNDVLITKDSESWNDIGVPALVEHTAPDLVCGYHLALLRPRSGLLNGSYLFRAMQSVGVAYQLHVEANGVTRYGLSHAAVKSVWLPLPPITEQAAIVRYIDCMDGRIRRHMRAKKKMIKLLEEQKQAIIRQAVTGQTDVRTSKPYPAYKDFGAEWLGRMPEHWEVRKLRSVFRRHGSGTTPSGDVYYGGGVPWVMTGDLSDGPIETTKRTVTSDALDQVSALRLFPPGSLIVAMYGATIGKTGILTMDACTNQACCVLAEPKPSTNPQYFQLVVNMARDHLIEQSYGGGQPNINADIVRSLRVPVPPVTEQMEIVDAIRRSAGQRAIERAHREVELLREYRTRLIADVVTGKLDVREAAAGISDDSDELAPIEDEELLAGSDGADEVAELETALEEVEA